MDASIQNQKMNNKIWWACNMESGYEDFSIHGTYRMQGDQSNADHSLYYEFV